MSLELQDLDCDVNSNTEQVLECTLNITSLWNWSEDVLLQISAVSIEDVDADELTDHLNLSTQKLVHVIRSVPSSVHRWIRSPLQLAFGGKGMLTSTFAEGGGFAKTRQDKDIPDIQFHFYRARSNVKWS